MKRSDNWQNAILKDEIASKWIHSMNNLCNNKYLASEKKIVDTIIYFM